MKSHKILVFCGSKLSDSERFKSEMRELSQKLFDCHYELIFGASNMGLMRVLCETAHALGVRITGVITKKLNEKGISYPYCDELIIEDNVHLRKMRMIELAQASICFPGGIGTVDEFFSVLASNSLHESNLPVILLNIEGYYDPLIKILEEMSRIGFVKSETLETIKIFESTEDAFKYLQKIL